MPFGLFGPRPSTPAPGIDAGRRDAMLAQIREHVSRGHLAAAEVRLEELELAFPDDPEVQKESGVMLYQRGEFDAAQAVFRRVLAATPGDAVALANLGQTLQVRGSFAAAAPFFEAALRAAPGLSFARFNLAVACYALGDTGRAIALCRELVAADPDDPSAHIALGEALLRAGRWDEGWTEYEWRLREPGYQSYFRHYAQPVWDGPDHPGDTVLIWPEQGFGDTLQFARLALIAASRFPAMRFVLEAPTALARVLEAGLPDARLPNLAITRSGRLPAFERHISIMSLALRLRVALDAGPTGVPYLRADPALVDIWRARLDRVLPAGVPRIGLTWAGNRREQLDASGQAVDFRRSLPAPAAASLTAVPGCAFVSLQVGPRAGELAALGATLADFSAELKDFADTAALMQCLDLVVSVDTAVVHLAGALGRPTWMLSRFDCCWRWGERAPRAPWYPTLEAFYQDAPGDWSGVIDRVRAALSTLPGGAAGHKARTTA
jgi:Flp pilus assembly protein TadD